MIQKCAHPLEIAPIRFVSLLQQGKDLLQMRHRDRPGPFLTQGSAATTARPCGTLLSAENLSYSRGDCHQPVVVVQPAEHRTCENGQLPEGTDVGAI